MSPTCPHPSPEPVTTVDGVHVGHLCPDCDAALPVDWTPNWQRNFFLNSAESAASVLMSAGFDPKDALAVVGLDDLDAHLLLLGREVPQ